VMLNAIATVHWSKGFWVTAGGYEYNLAIIAAAIAVAATGPGRFSIDNWLGWAGGLSGAWWGVGALAAAAVVSLITLAVGRTHTLQSGPATQSR
jgi:putative oxidoreductase